MLGAFRGRAFLRKVSYSGSVTLHNVQDAACGNSKNPAFPGTESKMKGLSVEWFEITQPVDRLVPRQNTPRVKCS